MFWMHWNFTMIEVFKTLKIGWRSRSIWWYTATSRTRARFARTVLGGFWLGISNLLAIASLSSVYGIVFKVQDFNEYVVYLGVGLVSWNAVSTSISSAPLLFEQNAAQLINTNTHPIFYTLEEWSFQLQNYIQSFLLVLIGLSFFQYDLFINLFLSGIFPLLNLIIFIYWFPVLIAIGGLRYKDFYQLIPIILQLIFLISPFLYRKDILGKYSWIADLNPLYKIISNLRDTIISGKLLFQELIPLFILNLLGLFVSIHIVNKSKKSLPFLI